MNNQHTLTAGACEELIERPLVHLFNYCKDKNWEGFDPYDALNSRLFALTPFSKSKLCRLVLTQILKRLPFDLRPLLMVTPEQNPKALALFLMAILRLTRLGLLNNGEELVEFMIDRLIALRSPDTAHWTWGYSFAWQTRKKLVPRGTPNLVCTTFVADAMLDAYEMTGDERCLLMASGASDYVLNELYWEEDDGSAGFSYPLPELRSRVHNANFLGAALLCRVRRHTGEQKYLEPALKVARHSSGRQHDDGSWDYGEFPTMRWIDNFHTGYNLCALRAMGTYVGTEEFEPHVRRGFAFYMNNFFMDDGAPKYFHNRAYPLDIHSVAQSIITLLSFKDLSANASDMSDAVFGWAMKHLWNERGYFYYQKFPHFTNKISYMRWSQAWMLLALTRLMEHCGTPQPNMAQTARTENMEMAGAKQ